MTEKLKKTLSTIKISLIFLHVHVWDSYLDSFIMYFVQSDVEKIHWNLVCTNWCMSWLTKKCLFFSILFYSWGAVDHGLSFPVHLLLSGEGGLLQSLTLVFKYVMTNAHTHTDVLVLLSLPLSLPLSLTHTQQTCMFICVPPFVLSYNLFCYRCSRPSMYSTPLK